MKPIMSFCTACILTFCMLCFSCKKEEVEPHPVAPLVTGDPDRALPYTYADWMAGLSDNLQLSQITIPGTHDCAADNHSGGIPSGSHWDVGCQDFRFSNQLLLGVRWFDVRYDDVDKRLHHDLIVLSRSLEDIIDEALSFLSAHPHETVIFMIKKEYGGSSDGTFSNKVWDILNKYSLNHFYLENKIPTLGNVRGKIVIATNGNSNRNGHPLGMSFSWPKNTPWHYSGASSTIHYYVQDHYSLNYVSYSTKLNEIKDMLNSSGNPIDTWNNFLLNFTSGEKDLRATSIKTVADNINGNIYHYLYERSHWRKRGVIMLNYAGGADDGDCCEPLVSMIIQLNDFEEVQIGSQVWMGKDLNVSQYRNGDPIPKVQDSAQLSQLTTGAYYEDDYGKHYNWYAVNESRGLAPTGWRIPTAADWDLLIQTTGYIPIPPGNISARFLKEAGYGHWGTSNTAQNKYFFTALPNAVRFAPNPLLYGFWWCATEYNTHNAIFYQMFQLDDVVKKLNDSKKMGLSVRLIKE